MSAFAKTGYGIEISFASGFLAEITGVTLPEWTRAEIDVSHTLSPDNAREYIMSQLVDHGELQVELNFDSSAVPPIYSDFEPVVATFPSGSTWSFSGALKSYGGEAPIDDRMVANATIKVSGKITIA